MEPAERALTIELAEGGPSLRALYVDGPRGAAVVAPPHPLYGGRMVNPVVAEITRGLVDADLAALRFDWRGVDGGTGEASGDAAAAGADYAAALARLAALHAGPYLGAGYSFGAATALAVAKSEPRLARLVLVSPPATIMPADAFAGFVGTALVLVGDDDRFAPVERVRALVERSPHTRLVVFDGVDHFFATEGLDRIAREITAFARG